MLQFPTNVYPHNVAVEIDEKHPFTSSYTFNGDLLRWGLCDYYDNVTGEKTLHAYFPKGGSIGTYYNGDTVRIGHQYTISYFDNGYDYKYRYTLFQSDPTEVENNDDSDGGLYNIFLLESYFWKAPDTKQYSTGGVYDVDENGNRINYQVVYVDGELSNIKPAYYYTYSDGRVKLVGGCYVEIDHERRFVEHVVKTTITKDGEQVSAYALYLTSPFKTTPKAGTRFRIFCNYVMSPFYFFKARKDPVISNMDANLVFRPQFAIQCDAKYQQANNVTMKYHRWYLYKCNHYETVLDGTGYIRDLVNEYNQASTVEEQNRIEQLINSIDNQVIPIATGLGDIVGKTIIISSVGETTDFRYSTTIKAYNPDTGLATLSMRLPITPIATTTNNPDNANETSISYEIVNITEQLVGDSGAVYSYDMPHTFYEFPLAKNDMGSDVKFRVRLEVCTQDGKIVYKDIYKTFVNSIRDDLTIDGLTNTTLTPIVDTTRRAIHLKWQRVSGCTYAVYRQRVDKTEAETPLVYFGSTNECYDYLVGNGKTYKYFIVPIYNYQQIGVTFITPDITPKWCGWSITALSNNNTLLYGKQKYTFDKATTWVLNYDKQSGAITQNQSRNTHIGINSYPRVSIDSSSYITGSFEAMLGNYDFSSFAFDDFIAKVERWRDFMSLETPYLLKTTKGDVWVVNITSEPTTTYDESLKGAPTSLSFEFTECENINNVTII